MKSNYPKSFLIRIFTVVLTVLFCSCENGKSGNYFPFLFSSENSTNSANRLNPGELVRWVQNPENGLLKTKTIDNVIYSIQYKPIDYIICEELETESIKDSILVRNYKELEGMEYFDFKIKLMDYEQEFLKYGINSQNEYQENVNYCAFKMQSDISLQNGNEIIPCALFHFERAYDASPEARFILGFEKPKDKVGENMTLVFEDKLFHKGIIKFNFNSLALKSTPKIKTL
ncbi:MAG: hypothetical protein IPP32_12675 [Bacteroidetes bacterium]|nr:hypothetical protein [Bacteroidota bacterium]